ncbi:hypothetical protein [uncultured Massilia sp.]|uniref:hypothetical protein n=1 Tax=uncultured Massilia sp. TaxID=169973 RepID=UPI002589C9B8|nr:hypothetical protein [uncultured Massilia sp.]
MQHTKTPWRIGKPSQMGSVVADEPVPEIKGSDAVEYYGGHLIAESIAPRNAEFIVRACNAHDQLVEALRSVRLEVDGADPFSADSYLPAEIMDRVNAALATALRGGA